MNAKFRLFALVIALTLSIAAIFTVPSFADEQPQAPTFSQVIACYYHVSTYECGDYWGPTYLPECGHSAKLYLKYLQLVFQDENYQGNYVDKGSQNGWNYTCGSMSGCRDDC